MKNFLKFLSNKTNLALVILVAASTTIACLIYYYADQVAEKSLFEQILHREQVIARAGAVSIESFFALVGNQVITYSSRESIKRPGERTQAELGNFMDLWQDYPLGGIILSDEKGEVIYNASRSDNPDIGANIAERDYFVFLKNQKKENQVFFGQPVISKLGASKEKFIVPVASGVIENGQFKGILATSIILSELVDKYLTSLKLSDKTRIYLLDQQGRVLSAPFEKLVGINYLEYLEKNTFKGSQETLIEFMSSLAGPEERKLQVFLLNEENRKVEEFLIAHAAVKFSGQGHWTLAIASTPETAYLFMGPFTKSFTLYLVFGLFAVIAFSAFSMTVIRIIQRNAYLDGVKYGEESARKK